MPLKNEQFNYILNAIIKDIEEDKLKQTNETRLKTLYAMWNQAKEKDIEIIEKYIDKLNTKD